MDLSAPMAGVGGAERGGVPAANEPDRPDAGGPVAHLHPTDRRGSRLSDDQVGLAPATDLPPGATSGAGPHPGGLPGLRCVEDPSEVDGPSRPGSRGPDGSGGTGPDQMLRGGAADQCRPRRRGAMRDATGRPSAHAPSATQDRHSLAAGPTSLAATDRDLIRHVVTTLPPCCPESPNGGLFGR